MTWILINGRCQIPRSRSYVSWECCYTWWRVVGLVEGWKVVEVWGWAELREDSPKMMRGEVRWRWGPIFISWRSQHLVSWAPATVSTVFVQMDKDEDNQHHLRFIKLHKGILVIFVVTETEQKAAAAAAAAPFAHGRGRLPHPHYHIHQIHDYHVIPSYYGVVKGAHRPWVQGTMTPKLSWPF